MPDQSNTEEKFYCPEHKFNPPPGSGFQFCPQCEIASLDAEGAQQAADGFERGKKQFDRFSAKMTEMSEFVNRMKRRVAELEDDNVKLQSGVVPDDRKIDYLDVYTTPVITKEGKQIVQLQFGNVILQLSPGDARRIGYFLADTALVVENEAYLREFLGGEVGLPFEHVANAILGFREFRAARADDDHFLSTNEAAVSEMAAKALPHDGH